jgi:DNA repair ATPase RecN
VGRSVCCWASGGRDLVRAGADKASVEGVFDAGARPDLLRTLDERGVEVEDGVVVLRREIGSAGRSRAWINGSTVTTATLAEVGRALVNIHGQHESQTLLNPEVQRAVLDAFGGATSQAAVASLRAAATWNVSLASRRAAENAPTTSATWKGARGGARGGGHDWRRRRRCRTWQNCGTPRTCARRSMARRRGRCWRWARPSAR